MSAITSKSLSACRTMRSEYRLSPRREGLAPRALMQAAVGQQHLNLHGPVLDGRRHVLQRHRRERRPSTGDPKIGTRAREYPTAKRVTTAIRTRPRSKSPGPPREETRPQRSGYSRLSRPKRATGAADPSRPCPWPKADRTRPGRRAAWPQCTPCRAGPGHEVSGQVDPRPANGAQVDLDESGGVGEQHFQLGPGVGVGTGAPVGADAALVPVPGPVGLLIRMSNRRRHRPPVTALARQRPDLIAVLVQQPGSRAVEQERPAVVENSTS